MKTATFTIARPDTGAVLPYASVTVYKTDGTTKATIVDAYDNPITGSALTADINGSITFGAADGTYILRAVSADTPPLTVPDITVDLYDLPAIQAAITQALSALTAAQGFCNALNVPATALPFEVTAITGGIGTGSGGTPGIYNLGVTGGPAGFKATVTIGGDGKIAGYTIVNPGLATTNSAPTLSLSGVTGLTGATTPTATVGTVPVNRLFLAPSADGLQLLTWYNKSGTGLNQYPDAPARQFSYALGDFILSLLNYLAVPGGDDALVIGKRSQPKLARIRKSTGGWDFLGVHILPMMADDGTVVATLSANTGRSSYLFSAFDRATRATLFGLKKDGTFVANIQVAEVTAARGTAADLNTRLSRSLTAAGSPKTGAQNLGYLEQYRSALTFLKLGGAALVHVIFDEDSWGDAKTYGTADAITRFDAESGLANAGPGWIGLASAIGGGTAFHGTARNNITISRTGTWTDLFRSADVTPGSPQDFPGYDAVQSGADGSIYTLTGSALGNCTSLTLYCGKGSGIEQSWDGTNWTAVTVASGSGSTTASINMTGKTNTLRLRCANGAVVAGLFGLSASSGVVFSNLSNSGSTSVQKASVQSDADYRAMMATLPGDVFLAVIQLGLNDTFRNTANATIVTNIGTIAAGYRSIYSGFPGCDIAVMCQPNCTGSVQDTLAPLLRAWAEDNGAAFLDWQPYFGIPSVSGDFSTYNRDYTSGAASTALPLLEVQTSYRHPSTTARLTAAGKSAVVTGAGVVASTLSAFLLSPLRSL
jgi:hypothetical protein